MVSTTSLTIQPKKQLVFNREKSKISLKPLFAATSRQIRAIHDQDISYL
jgi:hypothetical protein